MDRVAIKNKAKEVIRGNKWYIWKPYLIMMLISLGAVVVGALIDGLLGFIKEETVEGKAAEQTARWLHHRLPRYWIPGLRCVDRLWGR